MSAVALAAAGEALRAALRAIEEAARASAAPREPSDDDLLPGEVAGPLAGTTKRALREAARRGEIAAYGFRPVIYRRGDVLAWALARRVKPTARAMASAGLAADVDAALGLGGEP